MFAVITTFVPYVRAIQSFWRLMKLSNVSIIEVHVKCVSVITIICDPEMFFPAHKRHDVSDTRRIKPFCTVSREITNKTCC